MPILSNPKHELFAQELAKGKSAEEAFAMAGFSPNPGNARRLRGNEAVRKRVEAILIGREAATAKIAAKAVEKASISKVWVIEQLVENSAQAKAAGKFDASNSALKLIGSELLGMFIDRKEVKRVDDFSGMADEELETFIADRLPEPLGLTASTKVAGRS